MKSFQDPTSMNMSRDLPSLRAWAISRYKRKYFFRDNRRLDFRGFLESSTLLPESSREERGLVSRTAAGNRD